MSNFITYKASAGSGKTYTLAVEYIKQLLLSEEPHAHRHILAVTFTKEATGEMKDRIIAELYGLSAALPESKGFLQSVQKAMIEAGKAMTDAEVQQQAKRVLTEILHDFGRFYVGTIDSFFQRVLRNLARELGKGSKFNIELNTAKTIDEAVNAMIENSHENKSLLEWISRYVEERIEQGRSWKVDKELKSFGQNIFNEFFQEHEMDLRKQIAERPEIFTELIKEHRKRKDAFETQMEAFANLFFKYLEDNGISPLELGGGGSRPGYVASYYNKILSGKYVDDIFGSTVAKAMEDATKWAGGKLDKGRKLEIQQLAESTLVEHLTQTEHFRSDGLELYNSSMLLLKNIHQLALLWDIALTMEEQNRENNRFMLSQTAMFLNQMLADSDASFVYEKIGSEIKHVMIDEFQDTSRLQWRNFKSLLSEIVANNNYSLLVGDVKQSIYRWRNGDWSILNNLDREFETTSKTLSTNYRSEKNVVDFNNEFFVQAAKSLDYNLQEEFGAGMESPFKSAYDTANVFQHAVNAAPTGYASVDFLAKDEDADLSYEDVVYASIVEKLRLFRELGVTAKDICILTRTNVQIREIANYLSLQKDVEPELYKEGYLNIISGDAFQLGASPAIKIIVEALRLLMDWENPVPRAQLLMLWKEFDANNARNEMDMHALLSGANNVDSLLPKGFRKNDYAELELMPLYDLVLFIYRLFVAPILASGAEEKSEFVLLEQSDYMFSFMDGLTDYLQQNPSDIKAFLSYWDEDMHRRSVPKKSDLAGVQAMTIHKSKGLQFHTVLVPFCDWEMAKPSNFYQKSLVWCDKKAAPFDLEVLPIEYTKTMSRSVFSKEFAQETVQLWMDNLNVLYVAFTRAESNLCVLSKQKGKTSSVLTVDSLMNGMIRQLPGVVEDQCYQLGAIVASKQIQESHSSNVLKEKTHKDVLEIRFQANVEARETVEFRQSNKSKEFIETGENPQEKSYIKQGNVMHFLFSKIKTLDDVESAVDELIFEGLINAEEKASYLQQVTDAVQTSKVEQWFSGSYELFNECEILLKDENGKTRSRRPDRVMVGADDVIVVDYKFGEEHATHQKQVTQYIHLLNRMGYEKVKGYLWYVSDNKVVGV